MTHRAELKGFTLTELLVAMALAALVVTACISIVTAIHASWRSQQNLSALQHNARIAFTRFEEQVQPAGYITGPWAGTANAIHPETADSVSAYSDRLVLNRWSPDNCFGDPNPIRDSGGAPAYHLLESAFWINSSRNLTLRCRYGADPASLVTQLNSFGLVEDAHAMQLLFAEDSTGDLNADRWVRAGDWTDERAVLAVRIGLLLGTPESVHAPTRSPYAVLDEQISKQDSGKAFQVFETTIPIKGRTR